jgi:hypothetical protein
MFTDEPATKITEDEYRQLQVLSYTGENKITEYNKED